MAIQSLPRSSAKPRTYKLGTGIEKTHANRHFAVQIGSAGAGLLDPPTARLSGGAADGSILGELLDVDVENGEVSVLEYGVMYFRKANQYNAAENGHAILSTAGASNVADGIIKTRPAGNAGQNDAKQTGGATIKDADGTTDIHVIRAEKR